MSSEKILIERNGAVAHIILNRPDSLNVLSSELAGAILSTVDRLDREDDVRCIVLRGAGKGFAAGADISEMAPMDAPTMVRTDYFSQWDRLGDRRIPMVAAVHGFALGGGCELAMMCDIIIAAQSAKFGQPEIKLGVMPGMGGTQRLTRLIGRSRAMDLILTGRMIDAEEAERIGLISRVVPDDELIATAEEIATIIAGYARSAAQLAREAVDRADDLALADGLRFERRSFHSLFAGPDQSEGMRAFLEKRAPDFSHK